MKTRLLCILLTASLLAVAVATAFTFPASAQRVDERLPSGKIVKDDVPPGTSAEGIQAPETPASPQETTTTTTPQPPAPKPEPAPQPGPPSAGGGSPQGQTNSGERIRRQRQQPRELSAGPDPRARDEGRKRKKGRHKRRGDDRPKLRNPDGSPTPDNPGFVDALPGPSTAAGVPNFVIRKFRVPPFLLPIYQAAG
ncbi:MAG TPA: hypothetical protein VNC17_07110, partial [Thermoleophilaceae bacterium]|nr:hypothetical protein [Thermoleophilaceae bacterium]